MQRAERRHPMAHITLAKALKVKNRLTGRLAKVQADIQMYNSVPEGQADEVNVTALMKTREELVGALVRLKTAINEANRGAQRECVAKPLSRTARASGPPFSSSTSTARTRIRSGAAA
jgi:hypothetical protein